MSKQSLYIQITISMAATKKNALQQICFAIAAAKKVSQLCLNFCYQNIQLVAWYTANGHIYCYYVDATDIIRILHFYAELSTHPFFFSHSIFRYIVLRLCRNGACVMFEWLRVIHQKISSNTPCECMFELV